ncbi:MAG: hypothetical protein AAFY71_03835 [Bacteroidota bacterium]
MERLLIHRWQNLCEGFSLPEPVGNETFQRLKTHYDEKHRAYHNLHHIQDLFKKMDRDRELLQQPLRVALAIWFHDIIYKPYKSNNEVASAELFQKWMTPHLSDNSLVDQVSAYIVSTAKHIPELDHKDLTWFLDADLSILGAHQTRYLQYTKEIRKEYSLYPSFMYNRGRKAILKSMLARKNLFYTDLFQDRYEARARENIRMEIKMLGD